MANESAMNGMEINTILSFISNQNNCLNLYIRGKRAVYRMLIHAFRRGISKGIHL